MRIPYQILKYLFFPGAYIYAFFEHIICKICRIPVEKTGYVRFDEISGHPEHSLARGRKSAFFLMTIPGFINFSLGLWISLFGFINIKYMGVTIFDMPERLVMSIILLYIGVSLIISMFPLVESALNYKDISSQKAGIGAIFGFIPAKIALIGAYLEKYCIWQLLVIAATVFIILR